MVNQAVTPVQWYGNAEYSVKNAKKEGSFKEKERNSV